jgi:hypothetical protein
MKVLYKYLPPNRIDVLERCAMRLSQPCCLNDPHDSLVAIRSRLEEQDGADRVIADDFQVEKYYATRLRQDYSRQIGVLCFSSDPLSVLMWSHYSIAHTGFVLHFDTDDSFFDRKLRWKGGVFGGDSIFKGLPHPSPVTYSSVRKSYYLEDGIPWDVLFNKSEHWSYEREYRSLMNLSDAELVESSKDDIWPVYLIHFPSSAINGATIGLAATHDTRERVVSVCRELGVPVYQVRQNHLSFELASALIDDEA